MLALAQYQEQACRDCLRSCAGAHRLPDVLTRSVLCGCVSTLTWSRLAPATSWSR